MEKELFFDGAGTITSAPAVAQISTVTPTVANATVYTITIWGVTKTYTSDADATAQEIVEWLVAAAGVLPGVVVTEDNAKVILTASVAWTPFTATVSATNTLATTTANVAAATSTTFSKVFISNNVVTAK